MTTSFSTHAGTVTRASTFTKLLHHTDEARDCAATISHLFNTEDDDRSKLLARKWLAIADSYLQLRAMLVEAMKGTLS